MILRLVGFPPSDKVLSFLRRNHVHKGVGTAVGSGPLSRVSDAGTRPEESGGDLVPARLINGRTTARLAGWLAGWLDEWLAD